MEKTLDTFINEVQQQVEPCLLQVLTQSNYGSQLSEAMCYAALDGGKRFRPALVCASAYSFGVTHKPFLLACCCAVELIHTYSLVHDDLPAMDDDDWRRNKPSVHKQFDTATAVLVGDALQALAFGVLAEGSTDMVTEKKIDAEIQTEAVRILSSAAADMVAGQMLDMQGNGKQLNVEQLMTMHNLKSSALIRASLLLGLLNSKTLVDGDTYRQQVEQIDRYGMHLGLAFQISDDILDVIGSQTSLGKPQGSDLEQGKSTYVSILGMSEARQHLHQQSQKALEVLSGFELPVSYMRDLVIYINERIH